MNNRLDITEMAPSHKHHVEAIQIQLSSWHHSDAKEIEFCYR